MPDNMVLQILSAIDGTTRELRLEGGTIRIGRGRQCEVSIEDPELDEVHCLLRRRGLFWQIQPVGSGERITLAGRPLTQARLLPIGMLFRVGTAWLKLRGGRVGATQTFRDLLGSGRGRGEEVAPLRPPHSSWQPIEKAGDHPTRPPEPLDAPPSRATRPDWQPRRPVAARPPLGPSAAIASWEPHNPLAGSEPERRDRAWEPRPALIEPVEHVFGTEPERASSPPAEAEPDSGQTTNVNEPAAEARPKPPPITELLDRLVAPLTRALPAPQAAWPPPSTAHGMAAATTSVIEPAPISETATALTPAAPRSVPLRGVPPTWLVQEQFELEGVELAGGLDGIEERVAEPVPDEPAQPGVVVQDPATSRSPPSGVVASDPAVVESPEATVETENALEPPAQTASSEASPEPANPWQGVALGSFFAASEHTQPADVPHGGLDDLSDLGLQLPRVSDVLQAHAHERPRRTPSRPAGQPAARPAGDRVGLTRSDAPRSVTLSGWLAGPALAATILLAGPLLVWLSWLWAADDRAAGILMARLLSPSDQPWTEWDMPAETGSAWWQTTAGHLALRALGEGLVTGEAGSGREPGLAIGDRIQAARAAAPLDAQLRITWGTGEGLLALSASQDVWSMRRAAQALRVAGREPLARQAYRSAIERALASDVDPGTPTPFDEDRQTQRFELPGETGLMALLEELGHDPALAVGEWVEQLPGDPRVRLAVYRLLRAQGKRDAGDLVRQVEGLEPARAAEPGLGQAARGELLARSGQIAEAVPWYESAIVALPEGSLKRCLLYNLGDLHARLNHREPMLEAWERARSGDLSDCVDQRLAVAVQRYQAAGPATRVLAIGSPRDERLQPAALDLSGIEVPPGVGPEAPALAP